MTFLQGNPWWGARLVWEKEEKVSLFLLAGFVSWLHQYRCNKSTFYAVNLSTSGQAMSVHSFPMKSKIGWLTMFCTLMPHVPTLFRTSLTQTVRTGYVGHDVLYTPATHANLVQDITDADCQNGLCRSWHSVHSCHACQPCSGHHWRRPSERVM